MTHKSAFESGRGFRRTFLGLCHLLLLFLLLSEKSTNLVNGQLEAVGAVLSVVPVTSILATAGLVGVKLAALSRLLQALGYDQAYLASGGSGTAAQPIGLQTNYAYMFPYVPGLNISVRGEHGTDYHNPALQRQEAVRSTTRKTFPAMGLPGDYESQSSPFRGSETLREIFQGSGLSMQFPTMQQQQQQFNGFPTQGNGRIPNAYSVPNPENINVQPTATTPMSNPLAVNANPNSNQPPNVANNAPPPPPSSSESLMPPPQLSLQPLQTSLASNDANHRPQNAPIPQANQQPSFSNSQTQGQLDRQQHQTLQAQQQAQSHSQSQSSQVNMPHSQFGRPSQHVPFPYPHTTSQYATSAPFVSKPERPKLVGLDPGEQGHEFHPIPQHEYFYHRIIDEQNGDKWPKNRQTGADNVPAAPLPSGPLIQGPDLASLVQPVKPPATFEDLDNMLFGNRSSQPTGPVSSALNVGPVGQSNDPNDFITNVRPYPFVTDASPPFNDEMDHNEFTLIEKLRRKRRDASDTASVREPTMSASLANKLIPQRNQLKLQPTGNLETFGMPALNIHPLRRRKRSLGWKILSARGVFV